MNNNNLFSKELGLNLIKSWADSFKPFNTTNNNEDYDYAVAKFVTKHYLSNSILLPTMHPVTRTGFDSIYNYFINFIKKKPLVSFSDHALDNIQVSLAQEQFGVMSGYYNFLTQGEIINARYSMQFQCINTERAVTMNVNSQQISFTQQPGWYILMQHSSLCPIL